MSVAFNLYDSLRQAPDDDTRARLIAGAFESFEQRYPDLQHTATITDLSETELRLIKEIESVRLEIKSVEGSLRKEIESVRLEIKSVELHLAQMIHRQTLWVIGSIGTLMALMRFFDSLVH